jgi:hypothetical protein
MEYRTAGRIGNTSLGRLTSRLMLNKDQSFGASLSEASKMKLEAAATRLKSKVDPLNIIRLMSFNSPMITSAMGRLMRRSNKDIAYFSGNRMSGGYSDGQQHEGKGNSDGVYHTRVGAGRLQPVKHGDGMADIMAKLYNLTRAIHLEQVKNAEIKENFDEEQAYENRKKLEELFGKKEDKKHKLEKTPEKGLSVMDIAGGVALGSLLSSMLPRLLGWLAAVVVSEAFLTVVAASVAAYVAWKLLPAKVQQQLKDATDQREQRTIRANIDRYESEIVAAQDFNKEKKPYIETRTDASGKKQKFYTKEFVEKVQAYQTDPKMIKERSSRMEKYSKKDRDGNRAAIKQNTDATPLTEAKIPTPLPAWIKKGLAESKTWSDDNPSSVAEREKMALEFFQSLEGGGWTKEQATGIVANLKYESGLNPNKENGIGMYGLAQWDTYRRGKFKEFMGKEIEGSSFLDQLKFVSHELQAKEREAGTSLRNTKTKEEATEVIMHEYERPSAEEKAKSIGDRLKHAEKLSKIETNQLSDRINSSISQNQDLKTQSSQVSAAPVIVNNNNMVGGGNKGNQMVAKSEPRNDDPVLIRLQYQNVRTV